MNKSDLIKRIAGHTGMGGQVADVVVSNVFRMIAEELSGGNEVAIAGFGTFQVRQRAERVGRNPRTGESMTIPASRTAGFKPAKALREALN